MKHGLFLMTAGLAALAPATLLAQTPSASPVVGAASTVLSISAEGHSSRIPDLAVFTAGVTTQAKSASAALADNAQKMNAVVAALKSAGIAERDVQTSNLSVNPVYGQPRRLPDGSTEQQEPVIIGYQASNQVSVRHRKIEQYGRIIDTLVSAGANQVNGPSFQLDKPAAALDEARLEAMKAARARADLYAKAAGLRVMRVLTIAEGGGWSPPQPQVMYARAMEKDMAAAPSPVAAGELDVGITVNVAYELAP